MINYRGNENGRIRIEADSVQEFVERYQPDGCTTCNYDEETGFIAFENEHVKIYPVRVGASGLGPGTIRWQWFDERRPDCSESADPKARRARKGFTQATAQKAWDFARGNK